MRNPEFESSKLMNQAQEVRFTQTQVLEKMQRFMQKSPTARSMMEVIQIVRADSIGEILLDD